MEAGQVVTDGDLPKLRRLAGDLLAAEAPDPAVLDEIAALAASVASSCREQARQKLLGLVVEAARAVFPERAGQLAERLDQASHAELSRLSVLLDRAGDAHAALGRADSGLMAARDRGDYAAMVPLALEAEEKKRALAAAGAEFAGLVEGDKGRGPEVGGDAPDAGEETPEEPDAVPAEAEPAVAAAPAAAGGVLQLTDAMARPAATLVADPDGQADSPGGRRRIRDLIRQVRSMPEELPAAR